MNLHSCSISVSFQPNISTIAPLFPLVSYLGFLKGSKFQMKSTSSNSRVSPDNALTFILSISLKVESKTFTFSFCGSSLK